MSQNHELADAARGCRALRHAATLAAWVGPSRQVTAKHVLRRADVAAAARVAFADLEFQPGTVPAWLHAAYLTHLGRHPAAVTPPAGWDGLSNWVT